MKILYHHRTQRSGVEGVHISGLVNGLRDLGHEVVEVALVTESASGRTGISEKKGGITKRLFRWISRHVPNKVFRMLEIGYNPLAFLKMTGAISRHRPDIVYERYAYFNFAGVLAARLKKVPLLLEVNVTTHLADVRQLELQWLGRIIERKVLEKADAIIVVSNYLKAHLSSLGIDESKIYVQPNAYTVQLAGKDAADSLPEDVAGRLPGRVVIGFLGRLVPWYKLGSLLTAFHSVHSKYPHTFLLMIGDGTDRPLLQSMANQHGFNGDMYITGEVAHGQAMALLTSVNIGVIPSTNLWGSPMKLFEYMGQGIAVLAPDLDVITSVMTDGINGKTFVYDDFDDFERSLLTLVADDRFREELGKKARMHIVANHTWARVAENTISVADNLLSRRPRPPLERAE